jgi:hypothetical protein
MEAHGIGDHGSIVGEVEGGYESQAVAVAQVVVVVAQVVAEEDLVESWILRKWTNGNTLGGNSQTPELRR